MLREGDVFAGGRYRLVSHLGDGGSASVWRAEDTTLDREVAIKFLYAADPRYRDQITEQFLREAKLASAVKHRNVIQTVDFGTTDDNQAYMVMELLEGRDLGDRMGQEPPLHIDEVLDIIGQVLRGLTAIHEAGIIHRDLKPENVYLETDEDGPYPKILDFGIAKSIDKRTGRRSVLTTKEGVIVGTPEYMSPEQARGVPELDPPSDIWSVGVVLFELLAGRLPFDHPYSGELIIQIATTDAPRMIDIRPEVGKPISDVIAKALARDPTKRFQTAQEMYDALYAAVHEGVGPALPAGSSPRPPAPARRVLMLSGAIALVALGLLLFALRPSSEPADAAVAARPPPAAAEPTTVNVQLRGVPDNAVVLVNGREAKGDRLSLPNDKHARLIEVRAPGRQAWRVMHPAGNNADYEVRMPLAAPDGSVAPRATTAGATPEGSTATAGTEAPATDGSSEAAAGRAVAAPRATPKANAAASKDSLAAKKTSSPRRNRARIDGGVPLSTTEVWRQSDF